MTTVILTDVNLEEEVQAIRVLEAKENELRELRLEKEALIKRVMNDAGVEQMAIGAFVVRFTSHVRTSLDTGKLKQTFPEIFSMFRKNTNYRKFVIAA